MSALLSAHHAQLLIIDMQEKLLPAMDEPDLTLANCARLAQAANRLGAPLTVSEQYPKGIGASVEPLRTHISGACVLEKMSFSCMGDSAIAARLMELKAAGRRQILICGIEAHVCVLQSAIAAKAAGFDVFVAADATSSRASASKALALSRMSHAGVQIVSTEMAIFEWLAVAGTADFKALMPLVK
jgi:nicotinamidase-related amidase